MSQQKQLQLVQDYIHGLFSDDPTGHDFFHMKRVARLAKEISHRENADEFICEVAAWLHDVGDHKLFSDRDHVLAEMKHFLQSTGFSSSEINKIDDAIKDVSYSKGNVPTTLEGKIVQDADRIDAIGAIGIARTFAYGGSEGQLIFHDTEKESTSIQHFYDKLLNLKDLMNTTTAKHIAEERHEILERYLDQFLSEW